MSEEALRLKLYHDPNARLVLSAALAGQLMVIRPVPDATYGYRYPALEKMGFGPEESEDLLKSLVDSGIFKREVATNILVCPTCSSFRFILQPLCPTCKSIRLSRCSVFEHIPCGHIGLEQFFTVEGKLACPRCRAEFKKLGVDYRLAGVIFRCEACRATFDLPLFECWCQECGEQFSLPGARFKGLYEYVFDEAYREEISKHVLSLAPLMHLLEELGFKVEIPGYITGSSGVRQRFDIVARYPGVRAEYLAIDVAPGEASPEDVLRLFAKSVDARPKRSLLIAIPKLRDDAKPLLKAYKIECVEGEGAEQAAERLRGLLRA